MSARTPIKLVALIALTTQAVSGCFHYVALPLPVGMPDRPILLGDVRVVVNKTQTLMLRNATVVGDSLIGESWTAPGAPGVRMAFATRDLGAYEKRKVNAMASVGLGAIGGAVLGFVLVIVAVGALAGMMM